MYTSYEYTLSLLILSVPPTDVNIIYAKDLKRDGSFLSFGREYTQMPLTNHAIYHGSSYSFLPVNESFCTEYCTIPSNDP